MEASVAGALGLGFVLGLRHATDADHVAAVSTLVARQRSMVQSCLLGTFWGVGHMAALLGAGVLSIAFKTAISPEVEQALERAVAVMLLLLGGHVLLRTFGGTIMHRHPHRLGGRTHACAHAHVHVGDSTAHDPWHVWRLGRRPFAVGVLHGLAGSAALTLAVLATIPAPVAAVLYIVVFGMGATAGMLLLSSVMALPMVMVAHRSESLGRTLSSLSGVVSMLLGGWLLLAP